MGRKFLPLKKRYRNQGVHGVNHTIGKGEAESSILSRSTSFPLTILRAKVTERHPRANALAIRGCPREAKACAGRRRARRVTHGFWRSTRFGHRDDPL
jgi:hypothetical protein